MAPAKLSDAEVEEARRIIAVQAATAPADGNIGPEGAWGRAAGVVTHGNRAHDRITHQGYGLLERTRQARDAQGRRLHSP
jgi:hypothetical protein